MASQLEEKNDGPQENPSESESGGEIPAEDVIASTSQKKKKKKKSKATKGGGDLTQATENMQIVPGRAGVQDAMDTTGANKHQFWATQPVPQLGEGPPLDDGYIEPPKPREEVRQEPYPLPAEFEWCTVDVQDRHQNEELHDLLSLHYVEDQSVMLRFKYSSEFLLWALTPPGYFKEWHVGVRVSSNKKLVAFIAGIPITLRVRGKVFPASEVNYICIHKKLRSKRLAPVLIKEVTRQINLQGIFQAIYTAAAVIPTPISACRYYHRSLNVPKLIEVGFTPVPRSMTAARMIRTYALPSTLSLVIRAIEEKDVAGVAALFTRYMRRFDLAPVMTVDEVRHHFLSGNGTGKIGDGGAGRRIAQVTWTYVVENPETHTITDFFSFYSLPSSILRNPKHAVLEAGYLYYYATDAAFAGGDDGGADVEQRVTERLRALLGDALIIANQAQFDVFNATTVMDTVPVLKDLKFGLGDGILNYYLYNWRTAKLAGMEDEGNVKAGMGVGVVML
ncbi:Myristoyl-CoA:protein N-myristoyltransferase, N-terminal domain-containing protein [Mycena crocata]|nr:Myristoyl-CoA:protein N-myristoyltransferase, N-terminal domain-containing protein [Mycena crocata]